MEVAAIVLDMDGLMLDIEPIYKSAWQQGADDLGCQLDDALYWTLSGRRTEDCEQVLLDHFGSGFPLEAFRARWEALWRASVEHDGIATKAGLSRFLEFAEGQRLALAVATSSDLSHTTASLRAAGLHQRFDVVVTGDAVAEGKSTPDIYLETARQLGVEAPQCIAVEDSEAGITAARRAGMLPILIPDHRQPSPEAVAAAHRVLHSLDEARSLVASLVGSER